METIGKIPVLNTRNIVGPTTMMNGLVYNPPKWGKTTFVGSMDRMTRRFGGKPSLFVAIELGDGGGTASIQSLGVDYVMPTDIGELDSVILELSRDTKYGGVILDSSTAMVHQFMKPKALSFPNTRDKDPRRPAGVPGRSDYQTIGELTRQRLQSLVNLTMVYKLDKGVRVPDMDRRKHLFITALERTTIDEDSSEIKQIGPDLPGALMDTISSVVQTVGYLTIKKVVIPDPSNPKLTTNVLKRTFCVRQDGKRIAGDRFGLLPDESEPDLEIMYEKYWLPRVNRKEQNAAQEQVRAEEKAQGS